MSEKKKKSPESKKGGFSFKEFLKSRKARHGSVAIAITVVAVAVVVVINIITGLLVDRFPDLKIDFTANKAYALSDDTVDYMNHLKKDVTLYILASEDTFVNNGNYFMQAKNLLDKMESKSDGKFHVEYIDTTENPTFAQKYTGIDWTTRANVGVIESGERYKSLTLEDCFTYDQEYYSYTGGQYQFTGTTIEQAVVKGTLYVTSEETVLVDIITSEGEEDATAIKNLLTDNAYEVKEVSLLTGQLDENAQFAVLYAPLVDISETSLESINTWLENGGKYGKTLLYVPNTDPTLGALNTPNLDSLLASWGMELNTGYVYETSYDHMLNSMPEVAFTTDYTEYYTDGLKNSSIPVVAYFAHGINIKDESTAHALLTTSSAAGIMPLDADETFDEFAEVTGEPIAIAAEGSKAGTDSYSNVIVFSSSAIFSSQFLSVGSFNNAAYLMNVFNTIANKDDETVVIETKALGDSELGVTDAETANTMMIIFVFVIPIAILAVGIVVWIRRRNK